MTWVGSDGGEIIGRERLERQAGIVAGIGGNVGANLPDDLVGMGRCETISKRQVALDDRLDHLLVLADTVDDKSLRADFLRWIAAARAVAEFTERLRRGRWLPDPRSNVVLLLGERRFSIAQLEEALAAQRRVLADLKRLCAAERHLSPAGAAAFLATQPIDVVEQAA